MKINPLSRGLLWVAAILLSSLVCRAQSTDVGTAAAQMPDPDGAKIALQVSADNTYRWLLDKQDQGQITAAMGTKVTMVPAGRHEIVAKGPDGKTKFDQFIPVAAGKRNIIRIVDQSATRGATKTTAPPKVPTPAPVSPVTPTPQQQSAPIPERQRVPTAPATQPGPLGNPDMFVRVQLYASKGSAKSRVAARAAGMPVDSDWQVMASVIPLRGTYYDVKLQVVMKDVGEGQSSVELADSQPGPVPNLYMTRAEALGKEAVVCYTARPASQQSQRWTGTFNIQNGYQAGRVTFVPAHEPTLEAASDAPCGGLEVTKAAPLPPAVEGPGPREKAINPMNASLALAKGSRLYNARRYPEARPLLIQACEEGSSSDACNSVGFMYQNHMGVATDYAKAREYYLKACDDDSSLSCSNLGTLYRDGLGVPRDAHQAVALFEKGCDAGIPQGCDFGGKLYMQGLGVPLDGRRALDLLKRACDADLAAGCGDEGFIYAKGVGVPRDMPFAASLFKRACDLGSPNSCFDTGMTYRNGDGVQRDPQKAREYFSKACSLGERESCGLALQ